MQEISITRSLTIGMEEVQFTAIRAQGSGGQNVNKVSNAVHLRFDIHQSSLPERYKGALLALGDQRITKEGVIIIKAQEYRSLEKNREEACQRLAALIRNAGRTQKPRKATRPTLASRQRRKDTKIKQARTKALRKRVF